MDQIHDEFEAEHLYSQLQGLDWGVRGLNDAEGVKVSADCKVTTIYIYWVWPPPSIPVANEGL